MPCITVSKRTIVLMRAISPRIVEEPLKTEMKQMFMIYLRPQTIEMIKKHQRIHETIDQTIYRIFKKLARN